MTKPPYKIAMMMWLETGFSRHSDIYIGAQRYAEEQGWEVVIDEFADLCLAELSDGVAWPYQGVIARATQELAEHAGRLKMPVVNVWLNSPAADELPGVYPDYAEAGRLRAEHLLSRGVTRFTAMVADVAAHRRELESFTQTLAEHGYPCHTLQVSNNIAGTYEQWQQVGKALDIAIANFEPPVGVFAGSEMLGRVLAQRCRSHGLSVPDDVAIIAGHNESAFVDRPSPSLTSVDVGHERVGFEAARMLHTLMEGKAPPSRPLLLPPAGVVVRESTDFHVVEDELVEEALTFIAKNFQQRIGPDNVAQAVGVQTRTLQNRFRKALGWPVATEIRRVRVERAKRALSESDRLVADIAHDVGYADPMRLYEVFRRELGMSPTEFRKQRQALPD